MLNRFVRAISSMEFAVVILLIIAVVSSVGTVIDLGADADEAAYIDAFGPVVMKIATALDLHGGRMYGTRWFNALLALLTINLLLCAVNWLPRTLAAVTFAEPIKDARAIMDAKPSAVINDAAVDLHHIKRKLEPHGFESRISEHAGVKCLVAERHRHGHWGFFITHVGFFIIIVGVIMGKMWSEKGMIVIDEGTMNDVVNLRGGGEKHLSFALALEDFRIEYYSDLHVTSPGVAEPVSRTVDAGDRVTSPDGRYVLNVDKIVPDADLGPNGELVARSNDFVAPAMQVSILENGVAVDKVYLAPDERFVASDKTGLSLKYVIDPHNPPKDWISEIVVLRNGAPVGRRSVRVNHPLDYDGWRFYQSSYDQANLSYTVLEAAKDPGVPVVYAGCVVLLIGVSFIFFFSHRRIWAVQLAGKDAGAIVLCGWAYQAHRLSGEWFDDVVATLNVTKTGDKK